MAMTGSLRVTPEELSRTSAEFSTKASTVQGITNNMMQIVTGLGSAWRGDANTAYIQKFKGLEDDMTRLYKMIQEHSQDLQEMSTMYSQAEQANIEESNALPADAIQ